MQELLIFGSVLQKKNELRKSEILEEPQRKLAA